MYPNHVCKYRRGSDIGLEPIIVSTTRWQRICRTFNKYFVIASPTHHDTYRYLKSPKTLRKENATLLKQSAFVVHPFSKFRQFWDILMFFCLTLHLVIVPFVVAFFSEITTYDFFIISVTDTVLAAFLYVEIFLKFFTGFVNHDSMLIEVRKSEIVRHYLTGAFLLDLAGSAPYVGIMELLSEDEQQPDAYRHAVMDGTVKAAIHIMSISYSLNIFR